MPLPEYPRPRMVRVSPTSRNTTHDAYETATLREYRERGDPNVWQNLNGLWEWEPIPCLVPRVPCAGMNPPILCCPEGNYSTTPPFGRTLDRQILVPFPQESCLSGVAPKSTDEIAMRSWYRLTFDDKYQIHGTPEGGGIREGASKTLLHFGAVDWQALVYVNGVLVANHTGGYDGFTADITVALALRQQHAEHHTWNEEGREAPHELLVYVYDPSETGPQPHGKQRMGVLSNPGELWTIVYTSTTGIWQTVWLETVPADHIQGVQVKQSPSSPLDTITVTVSAKLSTPMHASSLPNMTIKNRKSSSPRIQNSLLTTTIDNIPINTNNPNNPPPQM